MKTRIAIPLLLAFAQVAVSSSVAQAAESAESTVEAAREDFERGNWAAAAKKLDDAAPKVAKPSDRAQAFKLLALARIELKEESAAEVAFVKALTADPLFDVDPVEVPPAALKLFRRVRERLEGTLVVRSKHAGARVTVDGVDKGPAPFRGSVPVGRRIVTVATADKAFASDPVNVVVRVDGAAEVDVAVRSRIVPPAVTLPTPKTVEPPLVLKATPERPREDRATRARKARTAGWILTGVATVAVIIGGVLYASSSPTLGADRDADTSAISSFNTRVNSGLGLLIGGAVTGGGAALLLVLGRD